MKTLAVRTSLGAALALPLLLSACGSGGGDAASSPPPTAHNSLGLMQLTVSGIGSDCDSAGQTATKQAAEALGGRYLGEVDVPCGKAQELYDQITEHGTNAVKEEKAIKEAILKTQLAETDQSPEK